MTNSGGLPVLDADVDTLIRKATLEVFSTMLGIEDVSAETLDPVHRSAGPRSGIFSLIGMAGAWAGTTSLVCSAEFACEISSRFLQAKFEAVNGEVLDAIAEMTNMIGGNIKTMLEQTLGEMRLSTPTVICGRDIQAHSARLNHWVVVRFACAAGELYVQTCLAPDQMSGGPGTAPGFQFPQFVTPM
jgi:chemotaxis protein CheX